MNSALECEHRATGECWSEIKGYSAFVLSSVAGIQSMQGSAKSPLLQDAILHNLEFFLDSLSEGWSPRIVVVRHGSELAGVVCARYRGILRGLRLGVVYADLTFGSTLLGDPIEQQNAFLVALETLLASRETRRMRLIVPRSSPELAAIQKLLASRSLDFEFCDFEGHAVLSLPGTYEELLRSFGTATRHNFRYYRRRFEAAGHIYLDTFSTDELRVAAFYLGPRCTKVKPSSSIDRILNMAAKADRPLAVGLRHRNGEWLSIICGVYKPAAGVLLLQLNNDKEFPRESLSVVLRAYLIESLIHQGMKELIIWNGTTPPLKRYVTYMRTLEIGHNSPDYTWRVVRRLKPWFPSQVKRWIVPPSPL